MPPLRRGARVAITTDWLTSFGGAERVLQELRSILPEAPIYTSVHDRDALPTPARDWPVHTTWLQRVPLPAAYSRALLPLMPGAFSRLDLSEFDIVLSMSSAFSKNVRVAPGAKNICYCLTPPRYLWDLQDAYLGKMARLFAAPITSWLRRVDLAAAQRVDAFVSISETVAQRVESVYGRSSGVIYPPVDTKRFASVEGSDEGYYLVVSRLTPYKRIDLAVRACTALHQRLIVVGVGPMARNLARLAGPTVQFLGRRSDDEVTTLMAGCRAFLFPGLEDFGIAPVEAQAAGKPVIAFGRGGAAETVLNMRTGVLFSEQTTEGLIQAIESFHRMTFDSGACRKNAQRFDSSVFRSQIAELLGEVESTRS